MRTSLANPMALASALRQQVPQARVGFRVSRVRTQLEINQSHTVRERLLATLALFFAMVALVLAGVGLYGALGTIPYSSEGAKSGFESRWVRKREASRGS